MTGEGTSKPWHLEWDLTNEPELISIIVRCVCSQEGAWWKENRCEHIWGGEKVVSCQGFAFTGVKTMMCTRQKQPLKMYTSSSLEPWLCRVTGQRRNTVAGGIRVDDQLTWDGKTTLDYPGSRVWSQAWKLKGGGTHSGMGVASRCCKSQENILCRGNSRKQSIWVLANPCFWAQWGLSDGQTASL